VVWFSPRLPKKRLSFHAGMEWPDPGLPASIERQQWNALEDPVARMGKWLKAGGA